MNSHAIMLCAAAGLLLGLVLLVLPSLRASVRRGNGRALFRAFAERHELTWSPPKNAQDLLAPGTVKGRYRERGVQISVDDHAGGQAARARGGNSKISVRAKLRHKVGAQVHGGSGGYKAKRGDPIALPKAMASFRLCAHDVSKAQARLASPGVAEALNGLARHGWVRLDDGSVECRLEISGTIEELVLQLDAVVDTAERLDTEQS